MVKGIKKGEEDYPKSTMIMMYILMTKSVIYSLSWEIDIFAAGQEMSGF
jgi:hypothetical protein